MALGLVLVAHARGCEDRLCLIERIAQHTGAERLQKVIVDAAREQVAIKAHVVHLADRDHHRAGLAYFGQRVDVVERVAAFRQVDHQDVRTGRDRQGLDRIAKPALVAFLGLPAEFDDHRAQHVERSFVAQECGEGIAVAGHGRFE